MNSLIEKWMIEQIKIIIEHCNDFDDELSVLKQSKLQMVQESEFILRWGLEFLSVAKNFKGMEKIKIMTEESMQNIFKEFVKACKQIEKRG